MGFQSTVFLQQGFGVPGELYTDSPFRAEPFILVSGLAAYNIIGATAYTITSDGIAQAGSGGALGFAGILVDPKNAALFGTVGNTLAPTLTLANNANGACLTMGQIIVTLPGACAVGDFVIYDNTTGALTTMVPGPSLPSGKSFAYATVDIISPTGAGLAVIRVSPTLTIPT